MKTSSSQPDVAALGTVVNVLDPLNEQQKLWVLQTAASRFSLKIPPVSSGGPSAAIPETPSSSSTTQIQNGQVSPKVFIRAKAPKSDVQRICCLAYYLTKYRSTPHFKTKHLTELNAEAAYPKFSNATVAANNARGDKYITPVGKGNKQLTNLGDDLVEALPDQDKVKNLSSASRSRKQRGRKKK